MSVTSPTVFLIRVLFELLANSNRSFPFPPIPPTNPPGAHRRAQSRSDSERDKIRYHFYHFKGQLPLVTARNCDSLRVSANAVLFYNSGCRHPLRHALRSRVSVLRNRRVSDSTGAVLDATWADDSSSKGKRKCLYFGAPFSGNWLMGKFARMSHGSLAETKGYRGRARDILDRI